MQIADWIGLKSDKNTGSAIYLSGLAAVGAGFYIAYLVHMTRIHSMPLLFHRNAESTLDVIAFLLTAIGIFLRYRAAALFAVIFLIWDQIPVFLSGSRLYQGLIILIALIFLRGAIAALISSENGVVVYEGAALEKVCAAAGVSQADPEKQPSKAPLKVIYAGAFTVLFVSICLFGLFTSRNKAEEEVEDQKKELPVDVIAADQTIFELLTGESVHGKILAEDGVYYQVDLGGKERILLKEDIKRVITPDISRAGEGEIG